MKKSFAMLIVGGLVTASALGLGFTNAIAGAAEKEAAHPVMHSEHKMDAMSPESNGMGDIMKSCEMHKECMEMMKNPEMHGKMQEMMKNPEMQAKMQEMMKNPEMHGKMQEKMKNPEMHGKMQEMMKNSEMQCTMKETTEENK